MFKKILIANRGEIACRIIDTCRELGIGTIAVYSDADRDAMHVQMADEAWRLGPASPTESYLNVDRLLDVAKQSGAEAIHPGYGFLSENADFARQAEKAGMVFIGPSAETIETMGSKSASKSLMDEAGVPVVPGYHGDDQDEKTLAGEADRIGFPLMIKAVSGGGGKGMRIVHRREDFVDALNGARREAKSSFGDDRVLIERFVEAPRHIEFQIFGDRHGNVVHLFERECSIQRRYQKVFEETPSPFLDEATREKMAEAAVNAAKATNYVNAGTVEFIVGADRSFFFMEMNTRLQVEHPVTEEVTGQDLVEWQIRVAAGETLPLAQDEIASEGHAVEARLYAENPDKDFLPAPGRIRRFVVPEGDDIRLDTGVGDGDEITSHYDPMIAKLTVVADDRPRAVAKLRSVLSRTAVFGLTTNLALLRAVAGDAHFESGDFDTRFLDQRLDELLASGRDVPAEALLAAAARHLTDLAARPPAQPEDPYSPWSISDGWRADGQAGTRLVLASPDGEEHTLWLSGRDGDYGMRYDGNDRAVRVLTDELGGFSLDVGHRQFSAHVERDGDDFLVALDGEGYRLTRRHPFAPEGAGMADETHPGSPMPGRIVAVHVAEGDPVEPGQPMLVLEGMKMEYTLKATVAGKVERLLYAEGDTVEAEVPLVDIAADE